MRGSTSFRRPHMIVRQQPGVYVEGVWQPGAEIETPIMATIQPATTGDYDRITAERGGQRLSRAIRVYTDTMLHVADPRSAQPATGGGTIQPGDIVLYPPSMYGTPERYRVIGVSPWQGGSRLDHFRYLAALEPAP